MCDSIFIYFQFEKKSKKGFEQGKFGEIKLFIIKQYISQIRIKYLQRMKKIKHKYTLSVNHPKENQHIYTLIRSESKQLNPFIKSPKYKNLLQTSVKNRKYSSLDLLITKQKLNVDDQQLQKSKHKNFNSFMYNSQRSIKRKKVFSAKIRIKDDAINKNDQNQSQTYEQQLKSNKKISIMNIQLPINKKAILHNQMEKQGAELVKNLLQKRKRQKLVQRQKQKEYFREKCLQLLQKNKKIKFQEEPNYRLIKQILSELKISRTNIQMQQLGIYREDSHIKLLSDIKTRSIINDKNCLQIKGISQQTKKSKHIRRQNKSQIKQFNDFKYLIEEEQKKSQIKYLEFLYKINFSNCIYINMHPNNTIKYNIYVGRGNNSLLIKNTIKKRSWFQILNKITPQVNLVWTQKTINNLHQNQKNIHKYQLSQQIKRKQQYLKNSKIVPTKQQLKILNKIDSLIITNCLKKYTIKSSIYQKKILNTVTNHIPQNYIIGSKKFLFYSLHYYLQILNRNPFQYIPFTYHIKSAQDPSFLQFLQKTKNQSADKVWILKPAQNTNRGNGISLISNQNIKFQLDQKFKQKKPQVSYIIQSYINRPFLYQNRKFDIRHYMLITSVNGIIKGYWYEEGYIRTSSNIYNIDNIDDRIMHLTNDAVQKRGQNYGKYQQGNKISYSIFQRYLNINYPNKKYNFDEILKKMKQISVQVIKATFINLDRKRKQNNFQLFGLDFMLDHHFKLYLIQINSNPCLQTSCSLLQKIIPTLIQNTFKIAIDPLFPPHPSLLNPLNHIWCQKILQNLRYSLIFDQKLQGQVIIKLLNNVQQNKSNRLMRLVQLNKDDNNGQIYDDEGNQINDM